MSGLLDHRLLFVTGKGGVGRTTVASALGILASGAGKRALVCEMEPRGDLARALECGPLSYTPRAVAPRLSAMVMDTEAALGEYLRLHLHLPVFTRLAPVAQALDFVAAAAPGVREVLTIGKLCYEVREGHYDLVVVDATASGHIVGHFAAPVALSELVRVGPVRSETQWMLELLGDAARTGVVVVATPEEMPVNEALELTGRLEEETGVALAAVVANRVLPELFSRGEEEDFEALRRPEALLLVEEALGGEVAAVLEGAALAVGIRRAGASHLARLAAALPAGVPLLHLPYLFGRAHGPRAVHRVAELLGEELSSS
ncbi:MAG TPA: ArsA family ATPase [Acidimicrobiales bacterium]|nr:ArsA family ATPase [Acidimicrobiales bacterium]